MWGVSPTRAGGAVEEAQQLARERHDQGAVLLGGEHDHGLQQA
jgi:hypothetical protein